MFLNIYVLCHDFILLALNFTVVIGFYFIFLKQLPEKICRFAQVIQLVNAISTFITPTLRSRGSCHCIGSLAIKMPACTQNNCTAVESETQAQTLILQWKHPRGCLSWQKLPWTDLLLTLRTCWPPAKLSKPAMWISFLRYSDNKGPQTQSIAFLRVFSSEPSWEVGCFLQAGYGRQGLVFQDTLWICSRAGTLLLSPQ